MQGCFCRQWEFAKHSSPATIAGRMEKRKKEERKGGGQNGKWIANDHNTSIRVNPGTFNRLWKPDARLINPRIAAFF